MPPDPDDPFASIFSDVITPTDESGLRSLTRQKAQQYGIDPDFAERQIQRESGFNPRARSEKGAVGLGQLKPSTAARYGYTEEDLYDPVKNLDAYGKHMSDLLGRFNGDYRLASAGYFAGEDSAEKALNNPAKNPKTNAYANALAQAAPASAPDPFQKVFSDVIQPAPAAPETVAPAPQAAKPKAPPKLPGAEIYQQFQAAKAEGNFPMMGMFGSQLKALGWEVRPGLGGWLYAKPPAPWQFGPSGTPVAPQLTDLLPPARRGRQLTQVPMPAPLPPQTAAQTAYANEMARRARMPWLQRTAENLVDVAMGTREDASRQTFGESFVNHLESIGGAIENVLGQAGGLAAKPFEAVGIQGAGDLAAYLRQGAAEERAKHPGLVSDTVRAITETGPYVLSGLTPVQMAMAGGGMAYGGGASPQEAIKQGLLTGSGVAAAGALGSKIPFGGIPGWLGRTAAATTGFEAPKIVGQAASNLLTGENQPVLPDREALLHSLAMMGGFELVGGPGEAYQARQKAAYDKARAEYVAGLPRTYANVVTPWERAAPLVLSPERLEGLLRDRGYTPEQLKALPPERQRAVMADVQKQVSVEEAPYPAGPPTEEPFTRRVAPPPPAPPPPTPPPEPEPHTEFISQPPPGPSLPRGVPGEIEHTEFIPSEEPKPVVPPPRTVYVRSADPDTGRAIIKRYEFVQDAGAKGIRVRDPETNEVSMLPVARTVKPSKYQGQVKYSTHGANFGEPLEVVRQLKDGRFEVRSENGEPRIYSNEDLTDDRPEYRRSTVSYGAGEVGRVRAENALGRLQAEQPDIVPGGVQPFGKGESYRYLYRNPNEIQAPPQAPQILLKEPARQERFRVGVTTLPPNAEGIAQGERNGAFFRSVGIGPETTIHAPDTTRNLAMANQIAAATGAQVQPNEGLGEWQNPLGGEPVNKETLAARTRWVKNPDETPVWNGRTGETFSAAAQRQAAAMGPLVARYERDPNSVQIVVSNYAGIKGRQAAILGPEGRPDSAQLDTTEFLKHDGEPGSIHRIYKGPDGRWRMTEIDPNLPRSEWPGGGIYFTRHGLTDFNKVPSKAEPGPAKPETIVARTLPKEVAGVQEAGIPEAPPVLEAPPAASPEDGPAEAARGPERVVPELPGREPAQDVIDQINRGIRTQDISHYSQRLTEAGVPLQDQVQHFNNAGFKFKDPSHLFATVRAFEMAKAGESLPELQHRGSGGTDPIPKGAVTLIGRIPIEHKLLILDKNGGSHWIQDPGGFLGNRSIKSFKKGEIDALPDLTDDLAKLGIPFGTYPHPDVVKRIAEALGIQGVTNIDDAPPKIAQLFEGYWKNYQKTLADLTNLPAEEAAAKASAEAKQVAANVAYNVELGGRETDHPLIMKWRKELDQKRPDFFSDESGHLDPRRLAIGAATKAYDLYQSGKDLKAATEEIVRDFGESVRPYVPKIWSTFNGSDPGLSDLQRGTPLGEILTRATQTVRDDQHEQALYQIRKNDLTKPGEFKAHMRGIYGSEVSDARIGRIWNEVQNYIDPATLRKSEVNEAASVLNRLRSRGEEAKAGVPSEITSPEGDMTAAQALALKRREWELLARQGENSRYWYDRSSQTVLDLFHGDKEQAEKFVQLLAIYSPKNGVQNNFTQALRAWNQHLAGQEIHAGGMPALDKKANALLPQPGSGQEPQDWSGRKTNNFYLNLMARIDPDVLPPDAAAMAGVVKGQAPSDAVTVDVHMMRAFGFNDTEEGNPTDARHNFVTGEVNRIARRFGWKPAEVQAAIWTGRRAIDGLSDLRENKPEQKKQKTPEQLLQGARTPMSSLTANDIDFKTAAHNVLGQIQFESGPGSTTGRLPGYVTATPEQKQEYHQAVLRVVEPVLRDAMTELGIPGGKIIQAPGVWHGAVSPGFQLQLPMAFSQKSRAGKEIPGASGKVDPSQRPQLDALTSLVGAIAGQDAAAWVKPFAEKETKVGDANTIDLNLGRTLTLDEAAELDAALEKHLGTDYTFTQGTENGTLIRRAGGTLTERQQAALDQLESKARLTSRQAETLKTLKTVRNHDNIDFHKKVKAAVESIWNADDGRPDTVRLNRVRADGNLIENDWRGGTDVESYRRRFSETGRPDIFQRYYDRARPQIEAIDQDFADRYGWDQAPAAAEPVTLSTRFPAEEAVFGRPEALGRGAEAARQGALGGDERPIFHWSQQEGISELDPALHGTGMRGAEVKRKAAYPDRFVDRSYVGYGDYRKEPGLGGIEYHGTLDFNRLYDLNADPDNLKAAAITNSKLPGHGDVATEVERLIKDAGYLGYRNDTTQSAAIFDKIPIEKASADESVTQAINAPANKTLYRKHVQGDVSFRPLRPGLPRRAFVDDNAGTVIGAAIGAQNAEGLSLRKSQIPWLAQRLTKIIDHFDLGKYNPIRALRDDLLEAAARGDHAYEIMSPYYSDLARRKALLRHEATHSAFEGLMQGLEPEQRAAKFAEFVNRLFGTGKDPKELTPGELAAHITSKILKAKGYGSGLNNLPYHALEVLGHLGGGPLHLSDPEAPLRFRLSLDRRVDLGQHVLETLRTVFGPDARSVFTRGSYEIREANRRFYEQEGKGTQAPATDATGAEGEGTAGLYQGGAAGGAPGEQPYAGGGTQPGADVGRVLPKGKRGAKKGAGEAGAQLELPLQHIYRPDDLRAAENRVRDAEETVRNTPLDADESELDAVREDLRNAQKRLQTERQRAEFIQNARDRFEAKMGRLTDDERSTLDDAVNEMARAMRPHQGDQALGLSRQDVINAISQNNPLEHLQRLANISRYEGGPFESAISRGGRIAPEVEAAHDYLKDAMKPFLEQEKGEIFKEPSQSEITLSKNFQGREQTETPEFKKWFGDSKITDEGGKPLVVYHGTATGDFDAFKRRLGDIGIHFGTLGQANDRIAYKNRNSETLAEGERLVPVYLRIKNPLRLDDLGAWNSENMGYALRPIIGDERMNGLLRSHRTANAQLAAMQRVLIGQGYDGIVYRNEGETAGAAELQAAQEQAMKALVASQRARGKQVNAYDAEDRETPEYKAFFDAYRKQAAFRRSNAEDSYIAFRPDQIKSAIGNRGTFDPNDRRILFSKGPPKPNQPEITLSKNFQGREQTETPEFKTWFKDSKVTDESGKPLALYHGTKGTFSEFDLGKAGSNNDTGMWGTGFYFSPNKNMSKGYGDKLMRVYLSLQNPLVLHANENWPEIVNGPYVQHETHGEEGKKWSDAMRQKLIDAGYDGVIQYERHFTNRMVMPSEKMSQVVAFYPEQIKSAIGNRGTFDPNSPNITLSKTPPKGDEVPQEPEPEEPEYDWSELNDTDTGINIITGEPDVSLAKAGATPKTPSQMIGIFKGDKLVGTASLSKDSDPDAWVKENYGEGYEHGPLAMDQSLADLTGKQLDLKINDDDPGPITQAKTRVLKAINENSVTGDPASTFLDMARIKGHEVYQLTKTFAGWSNQMIKRMGEAIRPHLETIWNEIKRFGSDEEGALRLPSPAQMKAAMTAGGKKLKEVTKDLYFSGYLTPSGAAKVGIGLAGKQGMDWSANLISSAVEALRAGVYGQAPRYRFTVGDAMSAAIRGAKTGAESVAATALGRQSMLSPYYKETDLGSGPATAALNSMHRLYASKENLFKGFRYESAMNEVANMMAQVDPSGLGGSLQSRADHYRNNPPQLAQIQGAVAGQYANLLDQLAQAAVDFQASQSKSHIPLTKQMGNKVLLVANPKDLMHAYSMMEATKGVGAQANALATALLNIKDWKVGDKEIFPANSKGAQKLAGALQMVVSAEIPFIKRPANAMATIVKDYLGISALAKAPQINDFLKGALDLPAHQDFLKAYSKGAIGLGLVAMGFGLQRAGMMSGAMEDDYKKKGALFIGDKAIQIGQVPFFGWLLTFGATLGEATSKALSDETAGEKAKGIVKGVGQMFAEHPLLRGAQAIGEQVGGLLRGETPKKSLGQHAGEMVSRFIPSPIASAAKFMDRNAEGRVIERRQNEGFLDPTKARIPGLRSQLPQREFLGRPQTESYFSPVPVRPTSELSTPAEQFALKKLAQMPSAPPTAEAAERRKTEQDITKLIRDGKDDEADNAAEKAVDDGILDVNDVKMLGKIANASFLERAVHRMPIEDAIDTYLKANPKERGLLRDVIDAKLVNTEKAAEAGKIPGKRIEAIQKKYASYDAAQ